MTATDAFEAWWVGQDRITLLGHEYGIARAAWQAATERAAGLVDAERTCECEGLVKDGGLDWCECYGYQTLRRLAARIRGGAT